jgi:hypothetical protein
VVRLPVLLHIVFLRWRWLRRVGSEPQLVTQEDFCKENPLTLTKPPDDGGGQHGLLKISGPTTDHALQVGAHWALCMGKTSYFRYRAEANVKLEATPKKAAHFIATLAAGSRFTDPRPDD